MIHRSVFWLSVFILPVMGFSQSMYSSMGMGDMTLPSTSRAQGLGVHGVAVPDYQEISLINPAYWHQLKFTGITTRLQSSKISDDNGGVNYRSAFDGFNFHFPIGDVAGIALGFAPLSYVNYHFLREQSAQFPNISGTTDTLDYSVELTGNGGVGSNFFGLGWKVSDRLSLGIAYSLIVGQIDLRRTMEMADENFASRYISTVANVFGGNLVLGGAFRNLLRKSDNVGLRLEIPLSLRVIKEQEYYNGVVSPIIESEEITNIAWPLEISIGYQTQLTGRWLAVAEMDYWYPTSDMNTLSPGTNYSQETGFQLGGGIELASDYRAEDWWQQLAWRTGVKYRQYLEANGNGDQSTGFEWVTGLGVPFGQDANRLDATLHLGKRSGFTSGDPGETTVGFSIGITVSELWFRGGPRNR